MGAINYYTSNYITLGLIPYDSQEMMDDEHFVAELRDLYELCDDALIQNTLEDYISSCYEDDYANVQREIERYSFWYYDVKIEPGYYEGFSISIESNFPVALDSWEDRRAANKEITEIRRFLEACAGMGLVKCCPGWCTSYSDYAGTMAAINAAIAEMRAELKSIPTWAQYNKGA